jgi:hypothetical protein
MYAYTIILYHCVQTTDELSKHYRHKTFIILNCSARASNNINNNDDFHEITVVKSMWQDGVVRLSNTDVFLFLLLCRPVRLSLTWWRDVSAAKRTTRFTIAISAFRSHRYVLYYFGIS